MSLVSSAKTDILDYDLHIADKRTNGIERKSKKRLGDADPASLQKSV